MIARLLVRGIKEESERVVNMRTEPRVGSDKRKGPRNVGGLKVKKAKKRILPPETPKGTSPVEALTLAQ